ncbi:MAG: response regulator, partial [Lachnospiraceae bacterium]|nr:response regulator [Lachnospiraceae bacterium]
LKTMSKLLEERGAATNVMWLGQDEFGSVYRYMMRILERYGIYAHKALFTIRRRSEDISDEIKDKMADSLREVIQSNLRNSDIMVRVGMDRFFLLLPELTPEHVERVTARIKGAWTKMKFKDDADVICEYESISPSGDKIKSASDIDAEHIVIVDDDGTNLMVAERIIRKEGMEVKCLKSGRELLEYLSSNYADLVLLDIKMPEMDGFETMQKLTTMGGRASKVPVIFLTASDDNDTEAKGFSLGAMDFIRKPFIPEILIMRVKHAIRLIRLQNRLRTEVNEEVRKNEELSIHIIQALAAAVDAKDIYTSGHSERVAKYSRMIAEEIGYDENAANNIYIMGLLHDVGKIGISDEIINKKGSLTDEEYEIIKTHTTKGANILDSIPEMPGLRTGAKWHHERYDGTGYPDGLSGKDIPEEARIIAVADSYDAMTSRRSYRDALPQDMVRSELEKGSGTQFDPRFAQIMIEKIDADTDYRMREV